MTSMFKLSVAALSAGLLAAETYYPPSESAGGWRRCAGDQEVRSEAGMDPQRLRLIGQMQLQLYGGPIDRSREPCL